MPTTSAKRDVPLSSSLQVSHSRRYRDANPRGGVRGGHLAHHGAALRHWLEPLNLGLFPYMKPISPMETMKCVSQCRAVPGKHKFEEDAKPAHALGCPAMSWLVRRALADFSFCSVQLSFHITPEGRDWVGLFILGTFR